MNAHKLAEALREIADRDQDAAFYRAAAACEEEGEHEKNITAQCIERIVALEKTVKVYDVSLRAHAALFDQHMARIAALENAPWANDLDARIAALEAKTNHFYALRESIAALETGKPNIGWIRDLESRIDAMEEDTGRFTAWVQEIAALTKRVEALENDVRRLSDNQTFGSLGYAPPPAPEERCAKPGCALVREAACHTADTHYTRYHAFVPPAAASAAPSGREDTSPEQAQETAYRDGIYVLRPGERIVRDDPPEQARRTDEERERFFRWCVDILSFDETSNEDVLWRSWPGDAWRARLRPGERIVSGEGVRCHKWQNGRIYKCDGPGCSGVEHGVFYPDAPPRAEGE